MWHLVNEVLKIVDVLSYKCLEVESGFQLEFDGQFDVFLSEIGVDITHINKMKTKILKELPPYWYLWEEKRIELVPLEKVIGTSRCTVGESVFENVRVMKNGDRSAERFQNCFEFLNRMSLDELKKSYETTCPPVNMQYNIDEDQYYLIKDGNHRTLTAMLLGAKYIRAYVTKCHTDFCEKDKYLRSIQFYEKYNIKKIQKTFTGSYNITFKDGTKEYTICGFLKNKYTNGCQEMIKNMEEEIQNDKKSLERLKWIPNEMKKVILKYQKNHRLLQYINKEIYMNPSYEVVYFKHE